MQTISVELQQICGRSTHIIKCHTNTQSKKTNVIPTQLENKKEINYYSLTQASYQPLLLKPGWGGGEGKWPARKGHVHRGQSSALAPTNFRVRECAVQDVTGFLEISCGSAIATVTRLTLKRPWTLHEQIRSQLVNYDDFNGLANWGSSFSWRNGTKALQLQFPSSFRIDVKKASIVWPGT